MHIRTPSIWNTLWQLTLLLGLGLGLASCTKVNGTGKTIGLDTDLKLTIQADMDINPDANNRPSPVFVRMYELKSPMIFHQADFMTLYNKDKAVLEADFVNRQDLKIFVPGDKRESNLVLNPGTKFVALYAEFLQYQNANYKVIFPVTPGNIVGNRISVKITGNHMVLVEKK
ncbi:MAG TPA: type VI secretion system lipoprotein TssJ [Cellvibrionaceae bacterium]|nr:type VI secretion system lipoprotein TssJ [Cellvibrionaceae bacterium]HMW50259.1 type VI secretion system lipoprotein TssJ [Cellvibrionaceae bacterium]HMW71912.1 type VI secretion system lipoprotein TssJ [Cellvibrionaceae bacterium]HMY39038.1 type VI secretion system lipoprotein TssJ [Marinagarivorans sp.]HNG59450.1 type VI secretion system lipoprotein TssJ [Cellvibrionaceae bacterium]